jgi:hypothetical protein
MSRAKDPLNAVVIQLQSLLATGEATRGLEVRRSRGGYILSRSWQPDPSASPALDPRFRLTPLGPNQFGLSLYRRSRWESLPFQGTLQELTEVMNTALAPWASED